MSWIAIGIPVRAHAEGDVSKSQVQAEGPTTNPGSETPSVESSTHAADKIPHAKLLEGATEVPGVVRMYRKDNQLWAEFESSTYGQEFMVLMAIARGIGQDPILGGMTWGNGDDWVWSFRKVSDKVLVVRKNVRFRATEGTPAATAVQYAYTDSVLHSLGVITVGPHGGDMVDITPIFMSDLPQISQVLPGFYFSADKSIITKVKGFERNVELELAATYASSGAQQFESVPDSRGVTIHVHYSISPLPKSGYTSRLADDRVGYFITALKDFTRNDARDRFIRYVNRWDLRKSDPAAKISPPKQPLVFWLENTIPYEYRPIVREGIEEWNKAFERAGLVHAIEVRQQPDDATWDPEDVNYNTFRWITSGAGFAMGPSRVNPYTGQILDADIIFDADFLTYWKREFETFSPESVLQLTGGAFDLKGYEQLRASQSTTGPWSLQSCRKQQEMARQFLFGTAAIGKTGAELAESSRRLIEQGLKGTVMHEVGHTLGLRHNFKGSAYLPLKDINDPQRSQGSAMLSSVMDYDAVNVTPEGTKQGDYYTTTIGPYDYWAIEYGYRPIEGGASAEKDELAKIAARSGESDLAYATDEDTRGIDPDPLSNRWDLGKDPLEFAARQAQLVAQRLPDVVTRLVKEGDDYSQARQAFNVLLSAHGQAMYFASRLIGGIELSRSHKGDAGGKPPFANVDAVRQRAALQLLKDNVFSDKPFLVPNELYSFLGTSRWMHWGTDVPFRTDYPVHDIILMWQTRMLDQILSSLTLSRIHDAELEAAATTDPFTTPELLRWTVDTVFSEVDGTKAEEYTVQKPAISSLRRNLQRTAMRRLADIAMGYTTAPDDCQTIAFSELKRLADKLDAAVRSDIRWDAYSRAHLEETLSRIRRVLEAHFQLQMP